MQNADSRSRSGDLLIHSAAKCVAKDAVWGVGVAKLKKKTGVTHDSPFFFKKGVQITSTTFWGARCEVVQQSYYPCVCANTSVQLLIRRKKKTKASAYWTNMIPNNSDIHTTLHSTTSTLNFQPNLKFYKIIMLLRNKSTL